MSWLSIFKKTDDPNAIALKAVVELKAEDFFVSYYFTSKKCLIERIEGELTRKLVDHLWENHKEEMIAAADFRKLIPTIERMTLERLVKRILSEETRRY